MPSCAASWRQRPRSRLVVGGAESSAPSGQIGQLGIPPRLLTRLGQHEENLEIPQVPRTEPVADRLGRSDRLPPGLELHQAGEAGHLAGTDVEGPLEEARLLPAVQLVRRAAEELEHEVIDSPGGVGLHLLHECGDQIEHVAGGAGLQEGACQREVGPAGVNGHPRGVRAAVGRPVGRLVQVPEEGDRRHSEPSAVQHASRTHVSTISRYFFIHVVARCVLSASTIRWSLGAERSALSRTQP